MKGVTAETDRQRWERDVLEPALKKAPERDVPFTTISGRPIDRLYTPDDLPGFDYHARPQPSRRVSLHPRHPSDRLPRQALDDAAVRRVRHAGRDQRALQGAARGRRHRPERRVRSADADGPRSRSRAVARRSREVRRQRHVARRHGAAVRRHPARRHHDVDDDQLAGADDLRDVPRRSPRSRAPTGGRCRARSRTTSSRNSSRRRNTSIPPRQSMRLITDIFAFCAKEVPRWNTISVSGYHIREAGSTALQELAFTLRDGIEYVQYGHRRRPRRRRLRAADLVLLQLAQRLLRGDREVPRRAEDLGRGDARPVRRAATSARGSCGSTPRRPASR